MCQWPSNLAEVKVAWGVLNILMFGPCLLKFTEDYGKFKGQDSLKNIFLKAHWKYLFRLTEAGRSLDFVLSNSPGDSDPPNVRIIGIYQSRLYNSQLSQWRICLQCRRIRVQFLGQEDPLKEEMATHSNILAWEIPWTEEPGGVSPWGHKIWTWLSN